MYNKEFKGDVCSHSHSFFLDNFIRRIIQNPKRIVGDYIQEGDTVIDLGCGPGFFTLDMARMTGEKGKVIAVDLQQEMLARVETKATRENLSQRIILHQCSQDGIGLDLMGKADFILAFYMVHETPDPRRFLEQVKLLLKIGGRFLLVEPFFHVSKTQFENTVAMSMDLGFICLDRPGSKGGRTALLTVQP